MTQYAQRDIIPCYWLHNVQYVPHFTEEQIFVAPGGVERTEKYLIDRGAIKSTDYLWERHWLKSF